jgi:hypothetical protein
MFGWVMSVYRDSEVLYFVPGVWSLIMYLLQAKVLLANGFNKDGLNFDMPNGLPTSFIRKPYYMRELEE